MKKWTLLVLFWIGPVYADLTPIELSRIMTISLNATSMIMTVNPMLGALLSFANHPDTGPTVANAEEAARSLFRINNYSSQILVYLLQIASGINDDSRLLVDRAYLESSRELLTCHHTAMPKLEEKELKFSPHQKQRFFYQLSLWIPIELNFLSDATHRLSYFQNLLAEFIHGRMLPTLAFAPEMALPTIPENLDYGPEMGREFLIDSPQSAESEL